MGLLKYSSPFSRQYWIDREVFSGAPMAKYQVIGAIFANSCYIYPVLIFLN